MCNKRTGKLFDHLSQGTETEEHLQSFLVKIGSSSSEAT